LHAMPSHQNNSYVHSNVRKLIKYIAHEGELIYNLPLES
jgi:hypothetical protein